MVYATQPALAAGGSVDASNVDISENSESITEVNLSPELTLDWDNFSSGVESFDITIDATADGSGNTGTPYALTNVSDDTDGDVTTFDTGDGSLADTTGTATVSLSEKGLATTITAIDASQDFPTDVQDGQSETTSLTLDISVTANNAAGNTANDTDTSSFDVTLTNPEATTDSSGTITTSGET